MKNRFRNRFIAFTVFTILFPGLKEIATHEYLSFVDFSIDNVYCQENNGENKKSEESSVDANVDEADLSDIDMSDLDKPSANKNKKGSKFIFKGFLKEEAAYSFDKADKSFSKVQTILNLTFDLNISQVWKGKCAVNGFYNFAYLINGRGKYNGDTLRKYEYETEIRDLYIDGSVNSWLNIKIGRQIIAWGESDFFQITDIANPRDYREPGMVDMEDARIPVAAFRINFLFNTWEFSFASIHEVRSNFIGPGGSDFDPFKTTRDIIGIDIGKEKVPDIDIKHTEFVGRIFKTFNGGDISIIAGSVYDDNAHLDLKYYYSGFLPLIKLTPKHKHIQTAGFAGNCIAGPFLMKFEAAYNHKRAMMRDDLAMQIFLNPSGTTLNTWTGKSTLVCMVGLEFTGITNLRFIVEGSFEHIIDYENNLYLYNNNDSYFALLIYDALNETLHFNVQYGYLRNYNSHILKASISYDIIDALKIETGAVCYFATDKKSLIYPFRNEDRVFASLKYSFMASM